MWIVVTLHMDTVHGPTMQAFGPWDYEVCHRERCRLLADFAHRESWDSSRSRFHAHVLPVVDRAVAP